MPYAAFEAGAHLFWYFNLNRLHFYFFGISDLMGRVELDACSAHEIGDALADGH